MDYSFRGAPAPDERRARASAMAGAPPLADWTPAVAYAVAVGATALAFAFTWALEPYLQRVVFILFWPAVVSAAWIGGMGPAIVASVLSVAAVDWLIIPPVGTFGLNSVSELVPLATFLVTSFFVSWLTDALRRERARAALAAQESLAMAERVEAQAVELEQNLEEAQATSEELEQSTEELAERTAAAEAAEQFARGILESIADPFVVQDREWKFRFINAQAAAVFGQSRHGPAPALIGRALWTVYPELRGTVFEREMRRAAEERVPTHFEAFYPERGEWSEMFCYPLPDGGLATQWKNVTERRRAEESTRYLARASDVLASSLDYEITLTELARVVVPELCDWCAVDILGEDGAVKQLAVAHTDPAKVRWARELNGRYPPDPDASTGVPNVLRTGKPELYEDISEAMLEASAVDAEHLRIMRELGLRSAIVVPLLARGHTLGALTLISSESRRRYTAADLGLASELARRAALAVDNARLHRAEAQARRAAQAAEAQVTRAFEQAPVAIAIVRGPDHVFHIANPRYTELVGRAGIVGKPVREALPDLHGQGFYELLDGVYASGAPYVGNETPVQLRRGAGAALEDARFNFVLQPLIGDRGTVEGIAIVAVEVTALVRAREAANEANLAKTQFLAVMSHELRTPLNAIAGYADLLSLGIRGPVTAEQQEDLARIVRSQRNLLSLINDVLNYAKLEAGHVAFATVRVTVAEVVAGLEGLVAPQLRARGVTYDDSGCDGNVAARADPEKMRQILLNLLSNAIKFTDAGGSIHVACEATDTEVRIHVQDTGVGIPADKRAAVFEPFVQLERRLTSAHEGTGLGLSISRDLARGMGGDLTVDSTVGKGSTFTLSLPRA